MAQDIVQSAFNLVNDNFFWFGVVTIGEVSVGFSCIKGMVVCKARERTRREIAAYVASGEWRGKAGGYAIQGLGAALIPSINGSYTNVVGLPLTETAAMLEGLGLRPPLTAGAAA